jgi:hypothetical protein
MVSSSIAIASSGVRAVRTRGRTWAGTRWGGCSGTLYHLAVRDALQHHLCCPDPRLELLGMVLRLELDKVLVRLSRPGIAAVVPLAAGGRLGTAPPPGEVSLGPVRKRDPHVPQRARGLGDLPLAMVGHEADLGVFAAAVVGRADLPRRFTGQTFLCLAMASCDSGTNGDRHHKSVDLAILTSLASLANFALLEVALALATPSKSSSPMEVGSTALESR